MADEICCENCVFKYNQLLNNPFPCNCCMRFSEFIPIDEESYGENFWLDDPQVAINIVDTIDEIVNKIEAIDTILNGFAIKQKTQDCVADLNSIKKTIVALYISDNIDILHSGRPWYDEPEPPEPEEVPF